MADPIRLRVHVNEPFDFERENETSELYGWTRDDGGEDAGDDSDEWEVHLEAPFTFNKTVYDRVLIGPRYVGEHLGKVHNALLGMPIRIAHRTPEGWHFAMTGMLSLAPPPPPPPPATDDEPPTES